MAPNQDRQRDRQARSALRALLEEPPAIQSINVRLAARQEGSLEFQWLPLEKPREDAKSAANRFSIVVRDILKTLAKRYGSATPDLCMHRSTVTPAPGQLEYLDLESKAGQYVWEQLEPLTKKGSFVNFDGDDSFLDYLRFYVISLQDHPLHCFRLLSPKIELGRSRRFAILGGDSGPYDLAEEKVLLFDDSIDCVLWKHWLYILKRTPFQQMFDYYAVLEEKKEEALEGLHELRVIRNFQSFQDDCKDIAVWTKLARISEGSLIQALRAPQEEAARRGPVEVPTKPHKVPEQFWERAEEVIEMFGLQLKVVGTGADKQFIYDTENRWHLLRLLDDDYLVSPQAPQPTSRGYQALHKVSTPLTYRVEVQRAEPESTIGPVALPTAKERKPLQRRGPTGKLPQEDRKSS